MRGKRMISIGLLAILLFMDVAFGQDTSTDTSDIYAPKGAVFSVRVPPGTKSVKHGTFDANRSVYQLITPFESVSKFYFENTKNDKRNFSVSILQLKIKSTRPPAFLTENQVETINVFLGDDIVVSDVSRETVKNVPTTTWHYRYRAFPGNEPHGHVYAMQKNGYLIILAIQYDWGKPNDPEIKEMLESFSIRD